MWCKRIVEKLGLIEVLLKLRSPSSLLHAFNILLEPTANKWVLGDTRTGEGFNSLYIAAFGSRNRMANILSIWIIVQIIGVDVVIHLSVAVMVKDGADWSIDG
jgi:hypothetical protein